MAQIIKLKRSLTAGSKPTTSNLGEGELAMNVTDGKLFLRKSGSAGDNIKEVVTLDHDGTLSGSLNITGSITASTPNAIVQVYDANDFQMIPGTLQIIDDDNIRATFPTAQSGYVVVARGGQIVSGSVDVENIAGLSGQVTANVNALGVFSSSAQITLTGDVTGTGAATVIGTVDGETF
jgi:hypothetical protein